MKESKGDSFLLYAIVISLGVIGFIIFKQVLFLILGALAAVLLLIFKN
nr:hypothetical protein [Tissierella sp.]